MNNSENDCLQIHRKSPIIIDGLTLICSQTIKGGLASRMLK